MDTRWTAVLCLAGSLMAGGAAALSENVAVPLAPDFIGNSPRVDIERFSVIGNSLLAPAEIDRLLAPHTGKDKSFSDIQQALEALEMAYKRKGFSAVSVSTPEQEVSAGVVTFIVTEAVVGKIVLDGNAYFDQENIRARLPHLREGHFPDTRMLSEDLRLANLNPARKLDVVLSLGDGEGEVDATVKVVDSDPLKFQFTLDNSGGVSTGEYRLGLGIQHYNLFNRDHRATLGYVTSPTQASQLSQVSASYLVPFEQQGGVLDILAAYSNTDAGSVPTVAGPLTFSGQGRIFGLHYTQLLPRREAYSARLTYGLDYRAYLNNCSLGNFGAAGCGPAAASVTVHPVSLGYEGRISSGARAAQYSVQLVHNLPGGTNGGTADFNAARPSPDGGEGARPDYTLMRAAASEAGMLFGDWQYRLAAVAQYAPQALIPGERIGLAGANAVRGFLEREYASDTGYIINMEVYTPELGPSLGLENSSFRLLAFLDHARGWRVQLSGETPERLSIGSAGLGFRIGIAENVMARFDVARILDSGGAALPGKTRGQFVLMVNW